MAAGRHLGKFQMAISLQRIIRSTPLLILGWSFRGRWIEWTYFRLDQIQGGGWPPSWKILNGHISATGRRIDFVFYPRVGFSGTADQMDLFPVSRNPTWRLAAILENFKWPYLCNGSSDRVRVGFSGTADRTDSFPVSPNPRWRPAAILEKFKWSYLCNRSSDGLRRVFADGGSNGAISGFTKSKMAAGRHLGKFQMAISLE